MFKGFFLYYYYGFKNNITYNINGFECEILIGHSNIIRTKKGKISTSGDTMHSKLKTKVYKSKALLTKVQSSESDDNMSDICKHFIIFQLNTFVVIFLSIPILIHHKLIVL